MSRETANDNVPTSTTTIEQIDNIIDNYANIVSDDEDENFVATQKDIDHNFVFPTPKRNHRQTLIPIVVVAVKTVNGVKLPRPLLCLLDSGSTGCLYNRRAIPYGSKTIKTKHSTVSTTTQGTYESNEIVMMEDVQMMEFTNSRHVRGVGASVFDSPTCPYDIILGRDFLRSIGLMIDFQTDTIVWLDERIDMKSINSIRNKLAMDDIGPQPDDRFYQQYIQETYFSLEESEDDFMLDDEWDNYSSEILGRKYGKVLPKDVASEQHHLNK